MKNVQVSLAQTQSMLLIIHKVVQRTIVKFAGASIAQIVLNTLECALDVYIETSHMCFRGVYEVIGL